MKAISHLLYGPENIIQEWLIPIEPCNVHVYFRGNTAAADHPGVE